MRMNQRVNGVWVWFVCVLVMCLSGRSALDNKGWYEYDCRNEEKKCTCSDTKWTEYVCDKISVETGQTVSTSRECPWGDCDSYDPCNDSLRFEIGVGGSFRPGAMSPGKLWVYTETWSEELGTPATLQSPWDSRIFYSGTDLRFYSRGGQLIQGKPLVSGISYPKASGSDTGIYIEAFDANHNLTSSNPVTFEVVYANGLRNVYEKDGNHPSRWLLASRVYPGGREESKADSHIEVIWDDQGWIRQMYTPRFLADVRTVQGQG